MLIRESPESYSEAPPTNPESLGSTAGFVSGIQSPPTCSKLMKLRATTEPVPSVTQTWSVPTAG